MPLPASENPMISGSMQQRFNQAGLGAFTPYIDPWATVARSRQIRDMERDFQLQDQIEDAEMGFMEALRESPTTGYQKFLQQNPLATLSPMVRAYVSTQERFGRGGGADREETVAKMGAPYLQTFRQGIQGGKDEIEAFADAISQREKDMLTAKDTGNIRQKFVESGGDLRQFPALQQQFGSDWASYQDFLNKNPMKKPLGASERNKFSEALTAYNDALATVDDLATDDAKREAFKLAKGRDPKSEQDWQEAYFMVKQNTLREPQGQLLQLAEVYQDRELPEAVTRVLGIAPPTTAVALSTQAPTPSRWPAEVPTTGPAFRTETAPAASFAATTAQAARPAPTRAQATSIASHADLKRITPESPVTFESLSRQMAQEGEKTRNARETDFLAEQAENKAISGQWEQAKTKLLQGLTPEMARILTPSPTEAQFTEIFQRAGIDPSQPAFQMNLRSGIPGRVVSWNEALVALANDPRIAQLQGRSATPARKGSLSRLWENPK